MAFAGNPQCSPPFRPSRNRPAFDLRCPGTWETEYMSPKPSCTGSSIRVLSIIWCKSKLGISSAAWRSPDYGPLLLSPSVKIRELHLEGLDVRVGTAGSCKPCLEPYHSSRTDSVLYLSTVGTMCAGSKNSALITGVQAARLTGV